MAQVTDWSTDNLLGGAFRAQLNGILAAIQSSSSGAVAPSPTVPGQPWLDTGVTPAMFRVRNEANSAWIDVGGFSGTFGATGFHYLPGGLLLHRGSFSLAAPAGSSQAVTFTPAFPNGILSYWVAVNNAAAEMIGILSPSATGMTITKGGTDATARAGRWCALGY